MYFVYLGLVVEIPQVQVAHTVHAGKQGRVCGRPHDIVHVVRVVLKRVQRLVVLQRERERESANVSIMHPSKLRQGSLEEIVQTLPLEYNVTKSVCKFTINNLSCK